MSEVLGLLNEALAEMKKATPEELSGVEIRKVVIALRSAVDVKWPDLMPPDVRT